MKVEMVTGRKEISRKMKFVEGTASRAVGDSPHNPANSLTSELSRNMKFVLYIYNVTHQKEPPTNS